MSAEVLAPMPAERRLTGPIVVSVLMHAALVALLFAMRPEAPPPMPPVYKVNLVAAPPGERAVGVVQPPRETPPPPTPTPPPPRSHPAPRRRRCTRRTTAGHECRSRTRPAE